MRRYISILIVAISIVVTSCNNFLVKEESTPPEGAFVSLAVGSSNSRTILPEAYDEVASLKNFTFTATGTTGAEVTHTFTDYDTLQTAQLFFTPDTYDCSLSVISAAGVKYEGVLEDKVIEPGDNLLAFKLQIVQLSTEPGTLEVQLTFPGEKVQMVKAGLYSIAGEVLSGFSEKVLEITDGNTVTYSNASVPGGNHLIKFSFYGDAECTVFLGMHTESVVIVSGKKSAATRSIESINPMYTITYVLNGGAFVEGYAEPDKFIPNMEIQLPTMFEVSKDNYCFLGWYEDADCSGAPVDTILRGTGENKTFYAKWALGKIVTASTVETLDLSSTSGEYRVVVTGEITSSTIRTLKDKLTTAGASAKIRLDLSQTTGLTSIGASAFEGCSGLTSVEIPAGVISIGASAFEGCSGLTSVEIPASVTSIGFRAFADCSGLTVYYQGELARWCEGFEGGYSLMNYCKNLYIDGELVHGDLVIPAGVTSIGSWAFDGCSGLTSVKIPASVTSIGSDAFDGCSGLTVYYQGDLARWCEGDWTYLMKYCKNLYINGELVHGDLVIPAGVTSIGSWAFDGCSGLTSVKIPAGVTSIGVSAFDGCSGLTSVDIPASVTSIDAFAFTNCIGLSSVTFEEGSRLESIGMRVFQYCSRLSSVEIPAGVTSIGTLAFYGCSRLSSVTFGEGSRLESISSSAFEGCSRLTSVEIPASVTIIGPSAFDGCSGLSSVTFGDTSGWYVTQSSTDAANKTGGTAVTLSSRDLAANARLVNGTYNKYYWYKVD